jgi:hypothetical protein
LRESGERQLAGIALNDLGLALHEAGRFDEAITAFQEYLAICKEAGDQDDEASAQANPEGPPPPGKPER